MTDEANKIEDALPQIPRILADFGGRRKVFERRLNLGTGRGLDRRTGKDRRSGFDRRSTYNRLPHDLPSKRRVTKG